MLLPWRREIAMYKAMRCLGLVARWSTIMVAIVVAVMAVGYLCYLTGIAITQALGLDSSWAVLISAFVFTVPALVHSSAGPR